MKKISFIALTALAILAISAFTFCSSGNAKTTDNSVEIEKTDEKVPAVRTSDKKKAVKKAVKSSNSSSVESSEISPKFKMEDDLKWYLDLNEAHAVSEKEDKPILGFFTGSDWCGWCIKLQNNVLKKEEFKTWAEDNVVLMEIDFPRRTKLDSALQVQNNQLQRVFSVTGFPTVWYFTGKKNDSTGQLNLTAMGKTGYPRSQPGMEAKTFIAASEGIINKPLETTEKK